MVDLGAMPLRQNARPNFKALVREASAALTRLDRARLEELAKSCAALSSTTPPVGAPEARETASEMAVLARILEAARANAEVMRRLRQARTEPVEYRVRQMCARVTENV